MNTKKIASRGSNAVNIFRDWCDKYPEITRSKTGDVFGIDLRTVHRYLSCETEPHGGVIRLLEVFTRHPSIEHEMIKRHGQ